MTKFGAYKDGLTLLEWAKIYYNRTDQTGRKYRQIYFGVIEIQLQFC